MARSTFESPQPARAVPVRLADLVLAVSLAACGGGGGSAGLTDTGAPLASGPPAPVPAAPAPSAAPTPAPSAAPSPAAVYAVRLLDPLGQAGRQSLNNLGQVAWTMVDPNAPRGLLAEPPQFGRFFDGSTTQPVEGDRVVHVAGLNDAGQVTGQIIESSDTRVFRWSPDAPDALVVIDFQPGTYTVANAINRKGQIAGMVTTRNIPGAFRWTPGPGLQGYEGLAPLSGAGTLPPVANAQFINDVGTAAGVSSTATGQVHATLWVPGQPARDLGSLGDGDVSVAGLNEANQVAGQAPVSPGVRHAYRWSEGEGMVDLGTLGGPTSAAAGINASGWVAGTSDTADGNGAFVWRDGTMTALGTLGGNASAATVINRGGQIGGTASTADGSPHAFLWSADSGMVDLNARLQAAAPGVLRNVVALADDGSMLADSSAGLVLLRPLGT